MGSAANRLARIALPLVVAGILAACGDSGAVKGPGSEPDPATDNAQTNPGGNGQDKGNGNRPEYRFTLPIGKPGADQHEATTYHYLQQGDCGAALRHLNERWRGFDGPRNVLLFQAGVDFCRGDNASGKRWFNRAARYGWGGTDRPNVCELYQAAASVTYQRAPSSFGCQSGEDEWPDGPKDDPRTPANEGTAPARKDPDGGEPDGGEPDGGASPGEAGPDQGGEPDDSPDTE